MRLAILFFGALAAMPAYGQSIGMFVPRISEKISQREAAPDFGYIVYDSVGKPIKAFGPTTPVVLGLDGKYSLPGSDLPVGSTIRIEDALTYEKIKQQLIDVSLVQEAGYQAYVDQFRSIVQSIADNAAYVRNTLCPHPARPTKVQVEIEGGFSALFSASMTSTVEWDLNELCKSPIKSD